MRGRRNFVDETSALTRRILEEFDTFAVVGLSSNPTKAAHSVPAAMKAYGWRIIPVNPHADRLLGEPVYRRLADIPEPVEVVNVFRPSAEAADIARQAVEIGAKALWLQLGIVSAEARRIAEEAGLLYVEDRCVAVERARHAVHHAA
jgi:predicted CoA-binding protein